MFKNQLKGELTVVVSEIKKKIKLDKKKIYSVAKKISKKYTLKDTVELFLKRKYQ